MADEFSPKDGGKVPKEDAERWIKSFDDERADKEKDTKSVFFGKDFLKQVIETPECAGVSFFFAKKPSKFAGKPILDLVLVPRKADGTLIWPSSNDGKDGGSSAYDSGRTCPPSC